MVRPKLSRNAHLHNFSEAIYVLPIGNKQMNKDFKKCNIKTVIKKSRLMMSL